LISCIAFYLLLCISVVWLCGIRALMLLVWHQKGHIACEKVSLQQVSKVFFIDTLEQGGSVLDSGAEGSGFKSQPRRCRVTVLGKLFTPIVPLFTKQRNW